VPPDCRRGAGSTSRMFSAPASAGDGPALPSRRTFARLVAGRRSALGPEQPRYFAREDRVLVDSLAVPFQTLARDRSGSVSNRARSAVVRTASQAAWPEVGAAAGSGGAGGRARGS